MHRNRGVGVLLGASLSVFLAAVSFTSVNIGLPAIQADFSASMTEIQWVVNAFFLTLAAFIVTAGRLADMYGHQRVIFIGLSIFTVASFIGGFSQNLVMMIICRGVQGFGAALIWPAGVAMAYHSLGKRRKGLAIGVVMGIAGMAYGVGPLIGGALVEYASWEWIFFYNVPVGLLALFYICWRMDNKPAPVTSRIDFVGLLSLVLGLLGLFLALDNANFWGWTSLVFILMLFASVVMLAVFFLIELRVREPIFDTHLLEHFSFSGILLARGLLLFSWMSMLFIMPIYFQKYHGLTPFVSGLYFLGLVAGVGIIQPMGGKIVDKLNVRLPVVIGFCLGILAFAVLWFVHVQGSLGAIFVGLLIFGFGYGLVSSGLSVSMVKALPKDRVGLASGIYYMVSVVGGAIGIAVTGFFLGQGGARYLTSHLNGLKISWNLTHLDGALLGTQEGFDALLKLAHGNNAQATQWLQSAFSAMFGDVLLLGLFINIFALIVALLSFYARKKRKAEAARSSLGGCL